jgi:hypothetical protein
MAGHAGAVRRGRRQAASPPRVAGDAARRQSVDHALIDLLVHGRIGRRDAEQRHQGPPGPAMGADHRVALERRVPGPDPQRDLPIVLAARRQELPLVGFPLGNDVGVPQHHLRVGQPLPFAEGYLGQPRLDPVAGGRDAKRGSYDRHGLTCPRQRARHVVEVRGRASFAREQIAQNLPAANGLHAARLIERDIEVALQPAGDVPVGQAVADVIEEHGSRRGTLIP